MKTVLSPLDRLAEANKSEVELYQNYSREELIRMLKYLQLRVNVLEKRDLEYSWKANPDGMGTMNNYTSYCEHCEQTIVVCGLCGMNTCSGGYGEIDGEPCPQCPTAYAEYTKLPMNIDELHQHILAQLRELQTHDDTELAHSQADMLLCELLVHLGYSDIALAYNAVPKWYA